MNDNLASATFADGYARSLAAFALPPADDAASAEADRFTAEYYARMGKRIVRPATPPAA